MNDSVARGGPVSFKDPPRLGNSNEIAKDAPTAAKLRKLNSSDNGGAKSARSQAVSAGRQSHRSAEPTCPYKDHTVEQMDVLIAESTSQIN